MHGVSGIPLLYAVPLEVEPPDEDEDPTAGEADSLYLTHDDEMIARAPILIDRDRCKGEMDHLQQHVPPGPQEGVVCPPHRLQRHLPLCVHQEILPARQWTWRLLRPEELPPGEGPRLNDGPRDGGKP